MPMALLSATSPAKTHLFCHEEHHQSSGGLLLSVAQCGSKRQRARGARLVVANAAVAESAPAASGTTTTSGRKPRVLVAGGGIGGLVFALAARRKGYDVTVFERDISAVRGEGQYRGPIQIQSNALAALEAIDMSVAEEVMREGCVTGDRINGLVDGISGSWFGRLLPLLIERRSGRLNKKNKDYDIPTAKRTDIGGQRLLERFQR